MKDDTMKAVAFYAAANAAALRGQERNLDWISLGEPTETPREAMVEALGDFVRQAGGAPPEALYRHAGGRGLHRSPPDGWTALPFDWRTAYATFATVLPALDRMLEALLVEDLAAAAAATGEPVLAAALSEDVRDTVFRTPADEPTMSPNIALTMIGGDLADAPAVENPSGATADPALAGDPEPAETGEADHSEPAGSAVSGDTVSASGDEVAPVEPERLDDDVAERDPVPDQGGAAAEAPAPAEDEPVKTRKRIGAARTAPL